MLGGQHDTLTYWLSIHQGFFLSLERVDNYTDMPPKTSMRGICVASIESIEIIRRISKVDRPICVSQLIGAGWRYAPSFLKQFGTLKEISSFLALNRTLVSLMPCLIVMIWTNKTGGCHEAIASHPLRGDWSFLVTDLRGRWRMAAGYAGLEGYRMECRCQPVAGENSGRFHIVSVHTTN